MTVRHNVNYTPKTHNTQNQIGDLTHVSVQWSSEIFFKGAGNKRVPSCNNLYRWDPATGAFAPLHTKGRWSIWSELLIEISAQRVHVRVCDWETHVAKNSSKIKELRKWNWLYTLPTKWIELCCFMYSVQTRSRLLSAVWPEWANFYRNWGQLVLKSKWKAIQRRSRDHICRSKIRTSDRGGRSRMWSGQRTHQQPE